MKKEDFNVTGMSCSSCANSIEKGVGKMPGVEAASVNYATEKLVIEYDESKVNIEEINNTVTKLGYKMEVKDKNNEIIIPISGMTCASCVAAVEKGIKKLDGISEVSVNLATEKAKVVYDQSKIRISEIKGAITNAGYKPLEIEKEEATNDRKDQEIRVLKKKLLVAIIFTIPLLYISMGYMIGFPIPNVIDPDLSPFNFAIVQLLLTIPVAVAGYKFYTIGFRNLFKGHPNMDSLIAMGTSAAIIYGLYAVFQILQGNHHYSHELYFETAGVIIALILLGKYL